MTSSVEGTTAAAALPEPLPSRGAPPLRDRQATSPFPGPRPFGPEEAGSFFGREREARDLLSLLVAHPIVVFYSQSGAGKSSLIQTKLLELLRERQYATAPVGRVSGAKISRRGNPYVANAVASWGGNPERTASLAQFIGEQPPAVDEDGDPSLRVVILDQFEELFSSSGADPESRRAFFEDVRDAVTQNPDVRLLFSLREEYLASLDPYARVVPGGLRGRMRLERLRGDKAREAIQRPFAQRGVALDDEASTRLLAQLQAVRLRDGSLVAGDEVEPVQLQVVCRRIWLRLREGATEVTARDVTSDFGDVQAALVEFYEDAVRRTARAARAREAGVRSWIERQLITESRTRGTAFRGEHKTAGIPNRVADELDRQLIVRKELRSGGDWYELTHDALIEPVLKSNTAFAKRRSRRSLGAVLVAICGAMVLVVFVVLARAPRTPPDVTPARPDAAALATLFWNEEPRRDAIIEQLRGLSPLSIEELFAPRPLQQGTERSGYRLRARYRAGTVDPSWLQYEWAYKAAALANRGFEIPYVIETLEDARLAPDEIVVELLNVTPAVSAGSPLGAPALGPSRASSLALGAGPASASPPPKQSSAPATPPVAEELPVQAAISEDVRVLSDYHFHTREPRAPVLMGLLPAEVAEQAAFARELRVLSPHQVEGGPWQIPPPWAWPLFRHTPGLLRPPEALVVQRLYEGLVESKPEMLLALPWLPRLLAYQRFNSGIADSKQDPIWKSITKFKCPAAFADALARAARGFRTLPHVEALLSRVMITEPPPFDGRCGETGVFESWDELRAVVERSAASPRPARMRIFAGSNLFDVILFERRLLEFELWARIDDAARDLYQQTGIIELLWQLNQEARLGADQFRIEIGDETANDWNARPRETTSDRAVGDLGDEIARRYRATTPTWLDTSLLRSQAAVWDGSGPPGVDSPLLARALQHVLAPEEPFKRCPVSIEASAGTTIDRLPWLARSLVFWKRVTDAETSRPLTDDPICLAQAFRFLQDHRLRPRAASASADNPPIALGLERLARFEDEAAADAFAQALRADPGKAIEDFASAYSAAEGNLAWEKLGEACTLGVGSNTRDFSGDAVTRYRAAQILQSDSADDFAKDRARLCLLQTYVSMGHLAGQREMLRELDAAREHRPDAWSNLDRALIEHFRFRSELPDFRLELRKRRPIPTALPELVKAGQQVSAALARVGMQGQQAALADATLSVCPVWGPLSAFCRDLPHTLARAAPDALELQLSIASRLAYQAWDAASEAEARESWERARQLLARAEAAVQTELADRPLTRAALMPAKLRELADQKGKLGAASLSMAKWRLSQLSEAERQQHRNALLKVAELAPGFELRDQRLSTAAWYSLVELAWFERDSKTLRETLGRARKAVPTSGMYWDCEEFWVALSDADGFAAANLLLSWAATPPVASSCWATPLAFAALLLPERLSPALFAAAGTSDGNPAGAAIAAAVARANNLERAQEELRPLWQRLRSETWRERLEHADSSVWDEVILGDFLDDAAARDLVASLEGDFSRSPLSRLTRPLDAFQREAYFYRALKLRLVRGARDPEAHALLQRVLETNEPSAAEFVAAKYLRSRG
jgi:hypothetical protein